MAQFLLYLGRIEDLAVAEVQSLFQTQVTFISPKLYSVESETLELFLQKALQSAGIIKAYQVIDSVFSDEQVQDSIIKLLSSENKVTFAFNNFSQLELTVEEIKKRLKEQGTATRFIQGREAYGLSAAVLTHHKVDEFTLFSNGDETLLAKTVWIQQIDDWSERDFGKPLRNPKKGMLPPKLARMMINLLSADLRQQPEKKLYDPFCGTGTVLLEASLLNWQVIGSDIDEEAVTATAKNLHWLKQLQEIPEPLALFQADVSQVTSQNITTKVDAIVTEPFLGKPSPRPEQLVNIFKGLEKLYLGAFKHWTTILKPGGEIVIVTPLVEENGKQYSLSRVIDNISRYGYTVLSGPYEYSRPQTIVKRAIYHLQLRS